MFTVTPADASCRALLLGLSANRASISPRSGAVRTVTVTAAAVGEIRAYVFCTHSTLRRSIVPATFTVLDAACSQALAVGGASPVVVPGRWKVGCTASRRGNAQTPYYAMSYTFTLPSASDVTVELAPDNNAPAYLDLVPAPGSGADPRQAFGTGPRISLRGLDAGAYTIETTHRDERTAGGFTLTLTAAASEPGWVKGLEDQQVVVGEQFSEGWTYGPPGTTLSMKPTQPSTGLDLEFRDRGLGVLGISSAGVAGEATHADTYTVTLALTQPGREDTRTLTVTAACADGHTRQSDRSCKPAVCPAVSWGTLGLDNRTAATAASWAATDCTSQNRPAGRYAKYFNFTLDAAHRVAIDLSSQHDTYLYLIEGRDTRQGYLHRNDNIDAFLISRDGLRGFQSACCAGVPDLGAGEGLAGVGGGGLADSGSSAARAVGDRVVVGGRSLLRCKAGRLCDDADADVAALDEAGPCGWPGPVCRGVGAYPPVREGGRLWMRWGHPDSRWGALAGEVLDLCDDGQALVVHGGPSAGAAVGAYRRRRDSEGGSSAAPPESPMGYVGPGFEVQTPEDSVVVLADTVNVIDGVLRGLVQNRSRSLWARNVVVSAADPNQRGQAWRFPLVVQPGEAAPFEIDRWSGSPHPSEAGLEVSADLSPTIDVTRALQMSYIRHTATRHDAAASGHGAAIAEMPESGSYDVVSVEMELQAPTSHPRLAEAVEQAQIGDLRVYAARLDPAGRVIDVLEPTPVATLLTSVDDAEPEHVEVRAIPTQLSDGTPAVWATVSIVLDNHASDPLVWAGSAAQTP